MSKKPCYILGIESSCDETSAVLKDNGFIKYYCKSGNTPKFNGLLPDLHLEHQKNIIPVVIEALNKQVLKKKI